MTCPPPWLSSRSQDSSLQSPPWALLAQASQACLKEEMEPQMTRSCYISDPGF